MEKTNKNIEEVIESYLRKEKSGRSIDEFIKACQNYKVLVRDRKNKGKVITSKDIFYNPEPSNIVRETSRQSRKDIEEMADSLKEDNTCIDNIYNFGAQPLENIIRFEETKPEQASSTTRDKITPTLKELRCNSNDIFDIIAKLKHAHLITPSVDKYVQTDEFKNKITLFESGELIDEEEKEASSNKKAIECKSQPVRATYRTYSNDLSELKFISDDESNASTAIGKPLKSLNNDNNEKLLQQLKNDTFGEQTENAFNERLRQEDLHLKQEGIKTSPLRRDSGYNTYVPHTSKCMEPPEQQSQLANVTNQTKEKTFEVPNTSANTLNANVNKNNDISKDCLGLFKHSVQEVIKTRRKYNNDGTINEVTETIIVTRHRHDPIETTLVDDGNEQTLMENKKFFEQFENDDVNFFTARDINMKGFKEGTGNSVHESSNDCKIAPRAESYIKHCLSCGNIERVEDSETEGVSKKVSEETSTKNRSQK